MKMLPPKSEVPCGTLNMLCKYDKRCPDSAEVAPLLVTGTGASGTLATLAKLEAIGFKLGGEMDGRDGTVAWNSRCDGPLAGRALVNNPAKRLTSFLKKRFHMVFHLVRHPLKTIASYQFFSLNMAVELNIKAWTFIESFSPEVNFRKPGKLARFFLTPHNIPYIHLLFIQMESGNTRSNESCCIGYLGTK